MITDSAIWAIFLSPLVAFGVIFLFLRPFLNKRPEISGYFSIACTGLSLGLSIWALIELMGAPGHAIDTADFTWLSIGSTLTIRMGIMLDSLSGIMLVVVTLVSLMVQIYSQGYMRGDPGYHRYFGFISLFTTSMLGLVLANNLLFTFMFWELVGLCSYLLIGFWFNRPAAARAAKKAFIVTRVGDFGFLAAILLLFSETHTLDIAQIHSLAIAGAIAGSALNWAAVGILMGAMGKSAQFPLHVWLPDAMEGPTPVSALIHAATMVAAGVYLVARMYPVFTAAETVLSAVAWIGGFTAIFAATMALVMTDIKRVLAYSTISQLGYMMLGLATGGVAVGIFHLFNHAFFKALLFLGAGSVNHATTTFDIRRTGGLGRLMPWTCATFVIASLSLAGVWPLAGFFSKEEILSHALTQQPAVFYLALITTFLTAFYMFRVVFLTFGGQYRGVPSHGMPPHESHSVMIAPMVALSVLAIFSGWLNLDGGFFSFLGADVEAGEGIWAPLTHPLSWISLTLVAAGIFLAYAIYARKWLRAERLQRLFWPFHLIFSRKYWIDDFYEGILVKRFLGGFLFRGLRAFDEKVIDGLVNGLGSATLHSGRWLRRLQVGELQIYALAMLLGIVVMGVVIVVLM